MLAKRIIPCLDIKNGRTVKGVNFLGLRDAGDPVELAVRYSEEGADELVFLDITATNEKRKTLIDLVREISRNITIPFTVGGGIKAADEIGDLLAAGADKVSLNSAIVVNPGLISEAAARFGSQCVVAAIDARLRPESPADAPHWHIFTRSGTYDTGLDAIDWVKEVTRRGAGEILLTSMDKDGTKSGYDIPLLRAVSAAVSLPLIASGGAGTIAHCIEAIKDGTADAVLAASIFHFKEIEIPDLKQQVSDAGIPVRL
ncbi:imidazole glycerol phosphate synthase subunit hisF [Cyclonatronum proteinivorum]|uniref:Imidazole glycerol phosphate synthase subunit HisF n=1 Tax=Cyclonatronum proteinivorum TaxID=1457365 RepID=A0A345UKJ5_9BACT|nr:imidazole glycerol phosphate synthase subunit HisF [Cyclonatronum proteinivorum]AXJ00997.1 imidazole glycerol phosphate synthase subunit hisF [Cyclonatronum proteinivorum]